LTGQIVDAEAKKRALVDWTVEGGFEALDTIAIGDGANDLLMMEAAGLSIAFCAKPVVRAAATLAIDERDMRLAIAMLGL
jgi:phosphoserine phosphatase